MIKNLVKHGNSTALILDRAILDLINIDPTQPVEISTDGKRLIISPVTDPERRRKFRAAIESVNRKHARTFKRLAE
ncbi:MAG TPA: hypothetical protein VIM11_23870 [Tepidisphaeraceae bacterium]|jgi:antitoxin component of MazEF toxin-antitoxin module